MGVTTYCDDWDNDDANQTNPCLKAHLPGKFSFRNRETDLKTVTRKKTNLWTSSASAPSPPSASGVAGSGFLGSVTGSLNKEISFRFFGKRIDRVDLTCLKKYLKNSRPPCWTSCFCLEHQHRTLLSLGILPPGSKFSLQTHFLICAPHIRSLPWWQWEKLSWWIHC